MTPPEFPLLSLFTRLRQAGLPLGLEEYQMALNALQAGFGLANWASLKRLCQTLWIKSPEEARVFDYHFAQFLHQTSYIGQTASPSISPEYAVQSPSFPLSDQSPNPSLPEQTPEIDVITEDEVQVVQAIKHSTISDEALAFSRYISSDEYFPVTRRQMKQSWRYLRRPPTELDIEATINEIGRKGALLEPVVVPRRINRSELLLLIDQDGSMVPFHLLSNRLIATILRGGRLGKAHTYYFHNCPDEYLYHDVAYQEYITLQDVFSQHYSQHTGVLIFSDGGAARGNFHPERFKLTTQFLEHLKLHFRYLVWLNPVPRSRWSGTTAGQIMQVIPMFQMSRQGLDQAINILRGRSSSSLPTVRSTSHE